MRVKQKNYLTSPPWNWPTYFKRGHLLTRLPNKYLCVYKAKTFCPFVKTCCRGSNPSAEQRAEWKVVVNECVRARSCHAGGSHCMDCIVMCKKEGYYGTLSVCKQLMLPIENKLLLCGQAAQADLRRVNPKSWPQSSPFFKLIHSVWTSLYYEWLKY